MYGQSYRTIPGQNLPFRWMAPEALMRRKFSEASDVWAFGVTAWEILTGGNMPFALISNDDTVAEKVCSGERLPRPTDCSEELWRLVVSCWKENAKDRPRFSDIATSLSRIVPTLPIKVQHLDSKISHIATGLSRLLPTLTIKLQHLLNFKTTILQFLPNETVAALKQRISDKEGEC